MKTQHDNSPLSLTLLGTLCLLCPQLSGAAPAIYYDEAAYLEALAGFGCTPFIESFEGAVWAPARQPGGYESGIISQGIGWAAGDAIRVTDFGHTGSNCVCNVGGTPDHISAASHLSPLVGVGGWFRETSATNVLISVDSGNPIASLVLAYYDYHFVGVIDTAGFRSFDFSTTSGNWVADDVIMAFMPLPRLAIHNRGSALQLSWTTNAPTCRLEYADGLPATVWNTVTNSPSIVGGEYVVTPDTAGSQRFYRLRSP